MIVPLPPNHAQIIAQPQHVPFPPIASYERLMYSVLNAHHPERADMLLASPSVFPSHKAVISFAYGRPIDSEEEAMLGMYLRIFKEDLHTRTDFIWLPDVVANFGVDFKVPESIYDEMDD